MDQCAGRQAATNPRRHLPFGFAAQRQRQGAEARAARRARRPRLLKSRPPWECTKESRVPKSYVEIDWQSHEGLRLNARVYDGPGPGAPTVLCLHGLTRNSRDFEDLAPHLQRLYRVIAPDL